MATNSTYRIADPVLTNVVHGYRQSDVIAPFIAPVVPVVNRAGKIPKFTKENFVVSDTRRAPGDAIKRVRVNYTNDSFYLNQHAIGAEVPTEQYEEAINSQAKMDLRSMAVTRASSTIMQSWELEVVGLVTDGANYESSLNVTTAGADQFNNSSSDPEVYIQEIKELIREQVGVYPTRMVLDAESYNALRFHPTFRDRVKYTSIGSVTADMMASWFDLPGGIRVATRAYLGADGLLTDFMPRGKAVLFFHPDDIGSVTDLNYNSFLPDPNSDMSRPAAFYTYQLAGYPIAGVERYDEDRRVWVTDVIAEQQVVPVGLGATGKIGAAALIGSLLA